MSTVFSTSLKVSRMVSASSSSRRAFSSSCRLAPVSFPTLLLLVLRLPPRQRMPSFLSIRSIISWKGRMVAELASISSSGF